MFALRINRALLIVLFACCAMCLSPRTALGQAEDRATSSAQNGIDVDADVQLYILVASNAAESAKLSSPLEAVARKLRPLLPFTNYRLGATFLSRVKNGRQLSVKGVGRTLLVTPALESSVNPTFYEISAGIVNLKPDGAGNEVVQFSQFRFGLRIPLQTAAAGSNNPGTVVYEPVGLSTDLTMREGEAVVVGTLDAGRPNETLVLVLVAQRASLH